MITDLDQTTQEPGPFDLCIIGSGPAGTTVAHELRNSGLRVCVLESGREQITRHGDDLRDVRSAGIHIKDYSRERVLGGASTTWAGLSSPLDPVDLEQRSFLDSPGWPFGFEVLKPLYQQAAERYRFPELAAFGPEGFGKLRSSGDLQPNWKELNEKIFLAADEPQNFGKEFREFYEGPQVELLLDATVLRLEGAEGAGQTCAVVRTRGGREFRIQARAFVIATGGIENARLLLKSRDTCPQGLGNEHNQVGRYLMNHPKNYHGILKLSKPTEELPYYFGCMQQGFAGYGGLRLPEQEQRERQLMNSYVRLEPLFPWSDSRGVESLVLLVKKATFLFRYWKRKQKGEVVSLRDYSETGDDSDFKNARRSTSEWFGLLFNVILDAPRVAKYAFFRVAKNRRPKIRRARLRNFMEMEPRATNRVELSEETDIYGEPLAQVNHQVSQRDKQSLIALHQALVREFEQAGVGELETSIEDFQEPGADWPIDQDASHHIGTTRMGVDPEKSVVNADCKLHSSNNVFLAGASVFPTSGCANPTFTIVALSIRLAAHLRQQLGQDTPQ